MHVKAVAPLNLGTSLVEITRKRAVEHGTQTAYVMLNRDGSLETCSYQELHRRAMGVAHLLRQHGPAGSRAILLYPPGLAYVQAFLGCLYAGWVAVPLYPPRPKQKRYRALGVLGDCGARAALVRTAELTMMRRFLDEEGPGQIQTLATDPSDTEEVEGDWPLPDLQQPAFLQYTSGSTGEPKGVVVTHGNLVANQRAIGEAFETTADDICLNWLPLYHDMGLIGAVLHPLYRGFTSYLMSPMDFIRDPFSWLEAISRYRATVAGAPNFAYELLANKVTDERHKQLDLSCWRVAFNGAEPVREQTLRRFAHSFSTCGFRLERFQLCYGMAEATLFVSGTRAGSGPTCREVSAAQLGANLLRPAQAGEVCATLVSNGWTRADIQVQIVDPQTTQVKAENEVGEIWVAGQSVAAGYWGKAELSAQVFQAHTAEGHGPFLRTGDLGALGPEGLFVTGRLKDLIIVRGCNHYPQDLEETVVSAVDGLNFDSGAAFSVSLGNDEAVVVVQEVTRAMVRQDKSLEHTALIRAAVAQKHELNLAAVVLLRPGQLPRTSSGKVQRSRARSMYLDGQFEVFYADISAEANAPRQVQLPPPETLLGENGIDLLSDILRDLISAIMGREPVDVLPQLALTSQGMDSMSAVTLHGRLEGHFGLAPALSEILGGSSPHQLAQSLLMALPARELNSRQTNSESDWSRAPLSHLQKAIWLHQQFQPESGAYNIPFAARFLTAPNKAALYTAFAQLLTRFPVLSTVCVCDQQQFESQVIKAENWFFEHECGPNAADLEKLLEDLAWRPFRLETEVPFRLHLIQQPEERFAFLMIIQHIAIDFHGLSLLMDDLQHLYQAALYQQRPQPPQVSGSYAAFARWQQAFVASQEGRAQLDWWRARLSPLPPPLALPTDFPRPARARFEGGEHHFRLEAGCAQAIRRFSAGYETTAYGGLLAVFEILLHRYSGQTEFCVGSPMVGRPPGFAETVGYFANMTVKRANLTPGISFRHLVSSNRQATLESLDRHLIPFSVLLEFLGGSRDPSYSPLFQVAFVLQQTAGSEHMAPFALGEAGADLHWGSLQLQSLAVPRRVAQFDLTLTLAFHNSTILARFDYNTDLFLPATVQQMARHYVHLMEVALAHPDQAVDRISLLNPEERASILAAWERKQLSSGRLPSKVFEQMAERHGDAVAITDLSENPSQNLTFAQLNHQANQLAVTLRKRAIGPESLVAIRFERNQAMVIALLAVSKAGAAYLPIDPSHPLGRQAYMLEDAGAQWLLVPKAENLPSGNFGVVSLREDGEEIAAGATANFDLVPYPYQLIYVLYTSGSTGKPKGVQLTCDNVMRLFDATRANFGFNEHDTWTLFHAYVFDFSVWEYWGALLFGGRLLVVPFSLSREPGAFLKLLQEERVTVLNQTPSAFRQLISALQAWGDQPPNLALRWVIFGGEALEPAMLKPWFETYGDAQPGLINMYGITETCVHVSYRPVTLADVARSTSQIGIPIADLGIHVLDPHLEPAPLGVPGEMYVAGAGLARGYLGRPGLTAERFVPNPFGADGERLYRSGDLARLVADPWGTCEISYLGRIDQQVKIAGHRIELGEIQSVLVGHPEINEAAVVTYQPKAALDHVAGSVVSGALASIRGFIKDEGRAKQETPKSLIAYLVCPEHRAPSVSELRVYLAEHLPSYMIPAHFVTLPALPLTVNGKLDRLQLPTPGQARPDLAVAYRAPRNRREATLCQVFERVLDVDRVGVDDSFFDLGGDSIRAISVRGMAAENGLQFSLADLFGHPSVAELANHSGTAEILADATESLAPFAMLSAADRALLPSGLVDAYPLARVQAGVIFHTQFEPDSPMYHDVFLYTLRSGCDEALLRKAVNQVVTGHEILRTSFDLTRYSEPLQLVHGSVTVPFAVVDFRQLTETARKQAVDAWIEAEKATPFVWTQAPMIRYFALRLSDDVFHLVLSFHDCIMDGWSTASMLTELLGRYRSLLDGRRWHESSPQKVLYRDFVALERAALVCDQHKAYWTKYLEGCCVLQLPREQDRAQQNTGIGVFNVPVSPETSSALRRLASLAGVPVKAVLLASHMRAMACFVANGDVLSGLEANGRLEETGAEKVIGIHLNSVPFRLKLDGGSWLDLVTQTHQTEMALLPFRRYPLADIQKAHPGVHLFEVVFNYTHFHVFEDLAAVDVIDAGGFGQTHFLLRVEFNQEPFSKNIALDLEANLAVLSEKALAQIGGYYERILGAMTENPNGHYEHFNPLSAEERNRILHTFNQARLSPSSWVNVADRFEHMVRLCAEKAAVTYKGECLSYGLLDRRANQLAHHLRRRGVGPDCLVGLCVERSLQLAVGILGILKAGAAYVPLDVDYPEDRLLFMVEDSGCQVLVSDGQIPFNAPVTRLCLSELAGENLAPLRVSFPEQAAYVIYTSGSTGKPKGVVVNHANLLHSTLCRDAFYPDPPSAFLLVSPVAFDSSVVGIFWTLLNGGNLVLPEAGLHRDVFYLARLVELWAVTHFLSVPSLYKAFLEHAPLACLETMGTVIVAGEASPEVLAELHYRKLPTATLYNEYGPTECSVWCSAWAYPRQQPFITYIGKPQADGQLYILDRHLQPVPEGVIGELAIGGAGVSRGYLRRPSLTAQRFVPDELSGQAGQRLYLTGDLARHHTDGLIQLKGRADQQIKIRGFRVELGEIRGVLEAAPGVSACEVLVREDGSGKQLVAFVIPSLEGASDEGSWRLYAKKHLAEHMIPSTFFSLTRWPLLPNGKVDLNALMAMEKPKPLSKDEKKARMAALLKQLEDLSPEEARALLIKMRKEESSASKQTGA